MKLYTYLPKLNTAETLGILATSKAPKGWLKYMLRSGAKNRLLVMLYLASLDPDRPDAVSLLRDPISDLAPLLMRLFRDAKLLYEVDLNTLKKLRILKSITTAVGRLPHRVKWPMKRHIDWKNMLRGKFLFSKVPHYLVSVKDGVIPILAITKKLSLQLMSFPLLLILDLKKRVANDDPVYTTRVSDDYHFKTGDIVKTPLSDLPMKVAWHNSIKDIKDHPFYLHLTPDQIDVLKKYKRIKILKLLRLSIADNPVYNQTAGADKNRVAIKDLVKYIKLNNLKAEDLKLSNISGLDLKLDNVWGNGLYKLALTLTPRLLASLHIPRILKADTGYPIIYNKDNGSVLDGVHRALKQIILGKKKIKAYKLSNLDIQKVING